MKRIAPCTIAIMIIGTTLVCLGQSLRKPDDYYNRGVGRQEKGDLDGAIADFSEAVAAEFSVAPTGPDNVRLNVSFPST